MPAFEGPCPVCGGTEFAAAAVMFESLIRAWELDADEVRYIDRQQGLQCTGCRNNLRAMALAAAILRVVRAPTNATLQEFCRSDAVVRMIEINAADSLTATLAQSPGHRRVEYPEFDMQDLALESGHYDLVIHSDTLEHIPDPVRALEECRRILRPTGALIFTVPTIVGRLSRSRTGLPPAYHGAPGTTAEDQRVHTEFGADVWTTVLTAGFPTCEIFALEYPAALVLIARPT